MKTMVFLFLFLSLALPLRAETLSGMTLADGYQMGGEMLLLNGISQHEKNFVAGLYLPRRMKDPQQILESETRRRMVLKFLRKVSKHKMCHQWKEGLKENFPEATPSLQVQFQTLCSWMETVQYGDRMVFVYRPGLGTEVMVKGRKKGILQGRSFADALLSVWIGDKPEGGDEFKQGILGG